MKQFLLFPILIILFFTTACTNYKELDQLALLSTIGFDKKDNQYQLVLKEVVAYKDDNSVDNSYHYHKVSCSKMWECFSKIKKTTPKTLYYNTIETMVIKKEIYHEIIEDVTNYDKLKKSLNDNVLVFVTEENILQLFKANNDYKYINNLVNNNHNSLLKIRKNRIEEKEYKIPILQIKNKDIIKTKSLKASDFNEK